MVKLPPDPKLSTPTCDVCGYTSKASNRRMALRNVRRHRESYHPGALPQADLNPKTYRGTMSELCGVRIDYDVKYKDGLLTEPFAKLATTHAVPGHYKLEAHKRQLNNSIYRALRGRSACAHGIDFDIYDAEKECWVGSVKDY